MRTKTLLRSFAGGEITPELYGRLDLSKFQTGLAKCLNAIVLPHGPASRRPGFAFINEAKDSTRPVRLLPFAFSASQTAILEFGHQYVRFHIDGATLLEDPVTISSISGSTVNTTAAHGFATGDWVYIGSRFFKVTVVDADTFTTTDLWGAAATATGTTTARVYTLATPYDSADLFDIHFAQSSDIVTLTHPKYAARELSRNGAADWSLTTISFAPPTAAPTGVTASATVAQSSNLTQQKYVVTAVQPDGVTESLASAPATCTNNLSLAGNFNTISWTGASSAARYNVYKLRSGIYGYIGQTTPSPGVSPVAITSATRGTPLSRSKIVKVTTATAHGFTTGDRVLVADTGIATFNGYWQITVTAANRFEYTSNAKTDYTAATTGQVSIPSLVLVDDNVLADTTQSPPEDIIGLNNEANDYPSTVMYHEQRRWFAGTNAKPQTVWATRTGTEANLTSSLPSRDADGMELRAAAMQNNQIRHLIALTDLIVLTSGGEFRIGADGDSAITPSTVSIKPQGYAGASNVQPVVGSGSVLFVQAQGSHLRELAYDWQRQAFASVDASIMAPHLFNGYSIVDMTFVRAPLPVLWAVRSDGVLLGLTYVPEQQVYGWHQHTTDGAFESVTSVAEGGEDVLYALVRRTVNGRTVRYVERLHTRVFVDQADAFYVDSGLTYSGSPVTTLSGLWHLEGKTVQVLADGAVHPTRVVTNGAIALLTAASKVHVGLKQVTDLVTLPLALEAPAGGQGYTKNVNGVALRVSQSSLVKAGPTVDDLTEYPARAVSDPYDSPPALRTGELRFDISPDWNSDGNICLRQDEPLPLTVMSIAVDVSVGG